MWVQPNVICLGGWSINLRDVRERLSRPEEDTGLRVPSAPTLSRARLRLDVLMMQWRAQRFKLEPEYFIYLSSDSSPQGGRDFLMSIEDSISRHHASLVVDGNPQALARLSLDPWVCKVGNFPLNLRTLFGSYYMSLISDFCWGKNRDPITRLITNARRAHCGQEPFRSASLALGIAMLVQNLKHYFKVRLVSWTRIPFALRGDMSYVIFPEGVIWMNFTTNDQWWMIRFRSTISDQSLFILWGYLRLLWRCRNTAEIFFWPVGLLRRLWDRMELHVCIMALWLSLYVSGTERAVANVCSTGYANHEKHALAPAWQESKKG